MGMYIAYIIAKLAQESNTRPRNEILPNEPKIKKWNLCKLHKYSVKSEYELNFCEC